MRYYFDIRDKCPVRDRQGREFASFGEAISHAKHLADDLRALATEVRPQLCVRVLSEDSRQVHEEYVFDREDDRPWVGSGSIGAPDAGETQAATANHRVLAD